MITTGSRSSAVRVGGVVVALALLCGGCTAGSGTDAADATDPAEAATETETETTVWDEAFTRLYGTEPADVDEIDGVAEDFPGQFPLAEGEVALSIVGDSTWDMVIETDEPEQAEQIAEAIAELVALEEEGPLPDGQEGYYWRFLDEAYAVQLEMRPGPNPPAMVGIMIFER